METSEYFCGIYANLSIPTMSKRSQLFLWWSTRCQRSSPGSWCKGLTRLYFCRGNLSIAFLEVLPKEHFIVSVVSWQNLYLFSSIAKLLPSKFNASVNFTLWLDFISNPWGLSDSCPIPFSVLASLMHNLTKNV